MNSTARYQRLARAARAWSPSAPVDRLALFAGRLSQMHDVIGAVSQRGQHVALYGERGVGKTSLANVIAEVYEQFEPEEGPVKTAMVNCNSEDTFNSLWRNVCREFPIDEDLGEDDLSPEDVRYLLSSIGGSSVVVIDELDRMDDDVSLSLLADTVKTLSDHAVPATLLLVGVAGSVEGLIGEHASVERALVQVEMPRMSVAELGEIIDTGCLRAELTIASDAKDRITLLSEGLPHYTHLLAHFGAQHTVSDDRFEITLGDAHKAIDQAVEKHTIKSEYQTATRSPRTDTLFADVLLACALAPKDELGFFAAGSVREPLFKIVGKRYEIPAFARHLNKFTDPARGSVLQKVGEPRRFFYRFANPLLQPYVILNGISTGRLDAAYLDELQREQQEAVDVAATVPNEPPRPI
jgi:energy-coupling factor transporter ATP-binding protein EcfA2